MDVNIPRHDGGDGVIKLVMFHGSDRGAPVAWSKVDIEDAHSFVVSGDNEFQNVTRIDDITFFNLVGARNDHRNSAFRSKYVVNARP